MDKDEIKNSLTIDQIYQLINDLGGEPLPPKNDIIISRTICHNPAGEGSYKLYYYGNSHLFKCYTDCEESYFDCFQLIQKQKKIASGIEWTLPMSINYIASYFGIETQDFDFERVSKLEDWDIIDKYEKLNKPKEKKNVSLYIYNKAILEHLPIVGIPAWREEGILDEVLIERNIRYDPSNDGIVIPHYDINDNLVGIRERTLVKEKEIFGKYKPAILNGAMYNHPLGYNLYNINNSKDNIKILKKVIVFESEKATMQFRSYYGADGDISVAVCGSSLIFYQVELLLSLGVREIIIAFDRQYKEIGDEEHKKWIRKLKEIHRRYSPYVLISFVFDKGNLLEYKNSPVDQGKENFSYLFERRIKL